MKVLWIVSTLEDVNFLNKFNKQFEGNIDVFHLNVITRVAMLKHFGRHLLPYFNKSIEDVSVDVDLNKTFNVLAGRLTFEEATKAYQATFSVLNDYFSAQESSEEIICVIPSGRHVHQISAKKVCYKYNIKTVFINYSNFPDYTFFDPSGTDKLSSIYNEPSLLDNLASADVETTFKKFLNLKNMQTEIPQKTQSTLVEMIKKTSFIIDTWLQKRLGLYGDRRVLKNTQNLRNVPSTEITYDSPVEGESFIFFPLQVSTDQQVLINYSRGSIYAAIDSAIELAKKEDIPLYIREHPAEKNKTKVRNYLIRKKVDNPSIFVTDMSVALLIKDCIEVITINSTVGLESRLALKPTRFLGDSFYSKATDQQLANYLEEYLIPVDYHSPKMTPFIVKKILLRASGE